MVKVVLIILLLPSLFAFEIDDEVDYDFTANLNAIFTTQPTDIDLTTTSISPTTPQKEDKKPDDGKCFCDKRLLQRISKLENELRLEKLKNEKEIIFKITDDDFDWFSSLPTTALPTTDPLPTTTTIPTTTTPTRRTTTSPPKTTFGQNAVIGQVRIFLLGAERSAHESVFCGDERDLVFS
jgi:hypothetical protein